MSRSYKKTKIVKDAGSSKKSYWKKVRRKFKTILKSADDIDEVILPEPKEIVNDYDYSDYSFNCENEEDCYCIKKYGRRKCTQK